MNSRTKKRALIAAACVSALVVAGVAFAYFTTTGSGTATDSVGSSSAVTLKATVPTTLYPGTSSTVTFTVDNPSPGAQRVGTISLSSITADAGHTPGCVVTTSGENPAFTMAPVAVNKVFPTGVNQAVTPPGSLVMNDTGISQDGCQGATLTLHLSSN